MLTNLEFSPVYHEIIQGFLVIDLVIFINVFIFLIFLEPLMLFVDECYKKKIYIYATPTHINSAPSWNPEYEALSPFSWTAASCRRSQPLGLFSLQKKTTTQNTTLVFLTALTFLTHCLPKACHTEEGIEFQSRNVFVVNRSISEQKNNNNNNICINRNANPFTHVKT